MVSSWVLSALNGFLKFGLIWLTSYITELVSIKPTSDCISLTKPVFGVNGIATQRLLVKVLLKALLLLRNPPPSFFKTGLGVTFDCETYVRSELSLITLYSRWLLNLLGSASSLK